MEEQQMKAVWRFATMENGEQFVMIAGMTSMLKLYVGNWASLILVSIYSKGNLLNS
jgi:hypothetical protein